MTDTVQYFPRISPINSGGIGLSGFAAPTIIASGTSGSVGPMTSPGRGAFFLAVMHRSTLTTPAGWTLLKTQKAGNDPQWLSLLMRETTGAETVNPTVSQSSAGRLVLGLCHVYGWFSVDTPASADWVNGNATFTESEPLPHVFAMAGYSVSTGIFTTNPKLPQLPLDPAGADNRLQMAFDESFEAKAIQIVPSANSLGNTYIVAPLRPLVT